MNGHDCTDTCGGICHLNAASQALYLDLIYADRFAEAEALRTSSGGWAVR